MKPGESTGELLARITNTMVIIKDSYASYENKPLAPANFDVNNSSPRQSADNGRMMHSTTPSSS